MTKRLRLIKVVVQPSFVVDDGETLQEMHTEPIVVTASDWAAFPERFAESIAEHEARLNAPPESSAPAS